MVFENISAKHHHATLAVVSNAWNWLYFGRSS
jgi:hypothetical protein